MTKHLLRRPRLWLTPALALATLTAGALGAHVALGQTPAASQRPHVAPRTPATSHTTPAATAPAPTTPAQPAPSAPAGMLAEGTAAPAFTAQDQDGHSRTLAEFRGHPVVLYFYPRDATPGCTVEACAFRDAWQRYTSAGAVVLGVSFDDVSSHARFAHDQHLPFPLLADPQGAIVTSYGVPHSGTFASRVTYLIDGAGVIRRVFPRVDPGVHANEVLQAIAALPH